MKWLRFPPRITTDLAPQSSRCTTSTHKSLGILGIFWVIILNLSNASLCTDCRKGIDLRYIVNTTPLHRLSMVTLRNTATSSCIWSHTFLHESFCSDHKTAVFFAGLRARNLYPIESWVAHYTVTWSEAIYSNIHMLDLIVPGKIIERSGEIRGPLPGILKFVLSCIPGFVSSWRMISTQPLRWKTLLSMRRWRWLLLGSISLLMHWQRRDCWGRLTYMSFQCWQSCSWWLF